VTVKQLSAAVGIGTPCSLIHARIITASHKIAAGKAMGGDGAVCKFVVLAAAFDGLLPNATLLASPSHLA
jgi:hypothetical protein